MSDVLPLKQGDGTDFAQFGTGDTVPSANVDWSQPGYIGSLYQDAAAFKGFINLSAATPVSASIVNNIGTVGSTTYTYVITVADPAGGETTGAGTSTTTGNASLNGTNYNEIIWGIGASTGDEYEFNIYRTVGGSTQGYIGSVAWTAAANGTFSFNDTGLVATTGSPPSSNTTGGINVPGIAKAATIHAGFIKPISGSTSANQVLGIDSTNAVLECKTITGSGSVTVTPSAGTLTISGVGFANPMTTQGDMIYGGTSGVATRVPPNTTATKLWLSQTSSAQPAWQAISSSDVDWSEPGVIGSAIPNNAIFAGSVQIQSISMGTPTVTPVGTTGSTTWKYGVTAITLLLGESTATTATITNGNSVLNGTNYNTIAWTAVEGAHAYNIYRLTSDGTPSSTGLIGSTGSTSFNDTGLTASGSAPSSNTTGTLEVNNAVIGDQLYIGSLTFLNNVAAGTLLGNFTGSAASPSFTSPGTIDQVLGVAHSGGGLEYKTIAAGSNITITPTAGSITIAATGFSNPMTTLGDLIYGGSSGAATRLAGNTTSSKEFLIQTGTGSASAAPSWGSIIASDLPSGIVGASGNLSPLFTTSISAQTLSFSLSSASATSWFGNASGSSAAPSFNTSALPTSLIPSISLSTMVSGVLPVANGGNGAAIASAYNVFWNGTNSTAAPGFSTLTAAGLPSTTVNSAGNLSPLFTTSISSQTLSFTQSNAAATSWFGNATGSSAAPSFNTSALPLSMGGTGQTNTTVVGGQAFVGPNIPGATAAAPNWSAIDMLFAMGGASNARPLMCNVPAAPTITHGGTAASTSYTYAVAAVMADGTTITAPSTTTNTTTGAGTLTGTNTNIISWTAVTGAATYNIYRTASSGTPSSTGLIGNTSSLTFTDTGIAATTATPTTGVMNGEYYHNGNWTQPCAITAKSPRFYINGVPTFNNTFSVSTECLGGAGALTAVANVSSAGCMGGGLGGGQNGAGMNGITGVGGGGGGFGGNGGNGGSNLAYGINNGGRAYLISQTLSGSGGGGGSGGQNGGGGAGGNGGGSFYLEATGAINFAAGTNITINGTAGGASSVAFSQGGGGGSGGGMDVRGLSTISIASTATITAGGGNGGAGTSSGAAGGGGGGGVIQMFGSSITNSGTNNVTAPGGAAGTPTATSSLAVGAGGAGTVTLNNFIIGPRRIA